MVANEHSLYSSYREMLLEHLFAGEIMKHLWQNGVVRMEVLKPQVDDRGYDLVLEANGIVRHVQLKASHKGTKTSRVNVNTALASKPSGCVIWIQFDPTTLILGPFLWLGDFPGRPLPNLSGFKLARHTRGNAQGIKGERANVRTVAKNHFQEVLTVQTLVQKLFG